MKTSVTELGDSRVRVDVGIEPDAVEQRLERAARQLAGEMRMPGFRKGKVPPQLVIQRVGRDAVLEQALRDSLPEWYERALLDSGITPVGDPQLNVSSLPDPGEELAFSIEVAVRPDAKLGEYKGLEVGRLEPEVPDDAVQAELDRLREGFASLNPVDRPAAEGDLVLIDYAGTVDGEPFEGSEASDLMVELGTASLLPESDEALAGASAGDEVVVEVDFPEDHQPESLAGKRARFEVRVKEVREKELPELDDDFAAEASEFETLEELVTDLESDAERALRREATLAAVADAEGIEVSDQEMLDALGPGEGEEAPARILERLRAGGRDSLLREELRLRQAAELIAASAKPIPREQAAAREKLWTPEKEQEEAGKRGEAGLWTPGEA